MTVKLISAWVADFGYALTSGLLPTQSDDDLAQLNAATVFYDVFYRWPSWRNPR